MRKALKRTILAVLIPLLAIAAWCVYYPFGPLSLKSSPVSFTINTGSSLRSVSQQMVQAGVLDAALPFEVLTRLLGDPKNVKAGNYEIESGVTPLELMEKLTRGDYNALAITFVEGWTFRQLRKVLNEHPALKHDTRDLSEAEILQQLGLQQESPEGLFFPDTYHFSQGVSDLNILRRSSQLMQKHLTAEWERRPPSHPLTTPYEALILASIVEKETGKPVERSLISAVFLNRLKAGMRLQTDPTVIYGLTGGQGSLGRALTRADLEADHPYNTYRIDGLPPGPIANPGRGALSAAVAPAPVDFLYFVANSDGGHTFATTLAEHNRNVARWRALQRQAGN